MTQPHRPFYWVYLLAPTVCGRSGITSTQPVAVASGAASESVHAPFFSADQDAAITCKKRAGTAGAEGEMFYGGSKLDSFLFSGEGRYCGSKGVPEPWGRIVVVGFIPAEKAASTRCEDCQSESGWQDTAVPKPLL